MAKNEPTKKYVCKTDLCPDNQLRERLGSGPGRLLRRGQAYELTDAEHKKYARFFDDPKKAVTKEAKKA